MCIVTGRHELIFVSILSVREPGETAAPKATEKVAASRQDVYAGKTTVNKLLKYGSLDFQSQRYM
jgi:hypothetical protein